MGLNAYTLLEGEPRVLQFRGKGVTLSREGKCHWLKAKTAEAPHLHGEEFKCRAR